MINKDQSGGRGEDLSSDLVAIIGMGCRFSGGANSPSAFWDLLAKGESGRTKIPSSRFNVSAFYHPNHKRPGSIAVDSAYFLADPEAHLAFDPSFFGIRGVEAESMDPHQRKMLEVAYECFESAGLTLDELAGSKTGVFMGNFTYGYHDTLQREPEYLPEYQWTGKTQSIISNRISHVFDLRGPSISVDTACSSSLYALHLACQSLQAGESTASLVGGTNLCLTVDMMLDISNAGMLSPRGVCNTFDAAADGYARGDGVGAVMLKKLSDAIRDGDPIRAVIVGSAINANGKTAGITHPDAVGQEAAIRQAYRNLNPNETGYLECHGTGTKVGDPIEVSALSKVFSSRMKNDPLLIGSVKTNVGHTEAAAGIASLIKVVYILEKKLIPGTIGITQLNPEIPFNEWNLQVPTSLTPWSQKAVYRASINSFGYGGANAHVVLEATDSILTRLQGCSSLDGAATPHVNRLTKEKGNSSVSGYESPTNRKKRYLLAFSAHAEHNLSAYVETLRNNAFFLSKDLQDLSYTFAARRTHFANRVFSVATQETLGFDLLSHNLSFGKSMKIAPKLAFVFTGQGAQWATMGATLIEAYPSVRKTFRELDMALRCLKDAPLWKIEDALLAGAGESRIHDPAMSQPLCTALQIGIVKLLASWSISPSGVLGHSSGELAAAYAAGFLTADEAIVLAYCRGLVVSGKSETTEGAMLAVGLDGAGVQAIIQSLQLGSGHELTVACYNSPQSTTVSGAKSAINLLQENLVTRGVFVRQLETGGKAYHSSFMKIIGEEYENRCYKALTRYWMSQGAQAMSSNHGRVVFASSVKGKVILPEGTLGPEYWRANLESPVLFVQATQALVQNIELGDNQKLNIIEIGPHAALRGPVSQIIATMYGESNTTVKYLPTLRKNEDNEENILKLVGSLYLQGYPVDLGIVNAKEIISVLPGGETAIKHVYGKIALDLPSYSWNYSTRYWQENRWSVEWRNRKHPRHDLLGSLIPSSTKTPLIWRNILSSKDVPWLKNHKVGDQIVFPAAAYITMALEAMTQVVSEKLQSTKFPLKSVEVFKITNFIINSPIILPNEDKQGVELLFELRSVDWTTSTRSQDTFDFNVTSFAGRSWAQNASGRISADELKHSMNDIRPLIEVSTGVVARSGEDWYREFDRVGLNYTGPFRELANIHATSSRTAEGTVPLIPDKSTNESRYLIHPATLDTCVQLAIVAAHDGDRSVIKNGYLPVSADEILVAANFDRFSLKGSIPLGYLQATARKCGLKAAIVGAQLRNQNALVVSIQNLRCSSVDSGFYPTADRHPYFREVWKPDIFLANSSQIRELCSNLGDDQAMVQEKYTGLERLAYLVILQTIDHLDGLTVVNSCTGNFDLPHLPKYIKWMKSRIKMAQHGHWPYLSCLTQLEPTKRDAEIQQVSQDLKSIGVIDARLMYHYYMNISKVFSGEAPAIEVLNEDGLWNEFYANGWTHQSGYLQIAKIAELLGHKDPTMKVLEIGAGTGGVTRILIKTLSGYTQFRQYGSYTFTDISPGFFPAAKEEFSGAEGIDFHVLNIEDDPEQQGFAPGTFDVVVAGNVLHATKDIATSLGYVRKLLKPGGKLLLFENTSDTLTAGFLMGGLPGWWILDDDSRWNGSLSEQEWLNLLHENGFDDTPCVALSDHQAPYSMLSTILATANDVEPTIQAQQEAAVMNLYDDVLQPIITLTGNLQSPLVSAISGLAEHNRYDIRTQSLEDSHHWSGGVVIVIDENELAPFILRAREPELASLKTAVGSASSLIWVTFGGAVDAKAPKHMMTSGFTRVVGLEHPEVPILNLDFDPDGKEYELMARIVLEQVQRQSEPEKRIIETILAEKNHLMYCSRVAPDIALNSERSQEQSGTKIMAPYHKYPLRVDIEFPGLLDTIYFKHDAVAGTDLGSDMVEIEVAVTGVNMKDLVNFMGKVDQDFFSNEAAGYIRRIGNSVKGLSVGDRVVALCEGHYGSFVRTSELCCVKLDDTESFENIVTMPVVYSTVIYCLLDVAHLRKGKAVLIHAAAGGVGIAAIQVAQSVGAVIFATVSTPEKKRYLKDKFSIPEDHIFNSRSKSFARDVKCATEGQGVDVTLNSTINELLHETFGCLKPFGIHLEIGMRDILDHGKLDMNLFLGSKTFFHFYLRDFIDHQLDEISRVLGVMMQMLRSGAIKPLPVTRFNITELEKAMRYFSEGKHIGKLVIDHSQTPHELVKVLPPPRQVQFDPGAAYIIVGGLGGIGRRISSWMVSKGAQNLIFLSRSGADASNNFAFIKSLEKLGATITIVKGDVSFRSNVRSAVAAAHALPIKGVIHAAMAMKDNLFMRIAHSDLRYVFASKVDGALNLHDEVPNVDLDFFVLTSSMAGHWGSEGQAVYAAANVFLDALARHRRYKGLPAASVALGRVSGVGYVAERETTKNILKQKGLYGINETELLRLIELAILDAGPSAESAGEVTTDAVLLSGLEPQKMKSLIDKGWFTGNAPQRRDVRFARIFTALDDLRRVETTMHEEKYIDRVRDRVSMENKSGGDAESILRKAFVAKFASIVGIDKDDIDDSRTVGNYGVDSMVGTELRNWIFRELAVDYPLLQLLSPAFSIGQTTRNLYELLKI